MSDPKHGPLPIDCQSPADFYQYGWQEIEYLRTMGYDGAFRMAGAHTIGDPLAMGWNDAMDAYGMPDAICGPEESVRIYCGHPRIT